MEASQRSQVLVSTHSPDLISRLPVENLRVIERIGQRQSHRSRLRRTTAGGERPALLIRGPAAPGDAPRECCVSGRLMRLGVIAEGYGDQPAIGVILRRLSGVHGDLAQVQTGSVYNAQGRPNLTKVNGIEAFSRLLAPEHDAVLVVLDADQDCPLTLAAGLATRMKTCALGVPVAVVCANQAFETWFLADIESVRGQSVKGRVLVNSAAQIQESPERIVNPKEATTRLADATRVLQGDAGSTCSGGPH